MKILFIFAVGLYANHCIVINDELMDEWPLIEKELLIRLMASDSRAFDTLYKRYAKDIFVRLRQLVHDRETAEELHQDVFMKVWEQRAALDPDVPFRAILMRTAKSKAIDYYRKVVRDQKLSEHFTVTATELYDHLDAWMAYKETSIALDNCIAKLPPKRQKIFRYCKLDWQSYEETAREFQVSLSTIKDHMTRSMNFLKEEMSKMDSSFLFWLLVISIFN